MSVVRVAMGYKQFLGTTKMCCRLFFNLFVCLCIYFGNVTVDVKKPT